MAILTVNWIIGLALMFGLALIMTYLTFKDAETFFIWLTVFCGFMVWGNLVELWVLIMNIIVLTLIIANHTRTRGNI